MSNQPVSPRRLGKNGPLVPPMGLGLVGMSMLYGQPPSDEERFKVLDRALELGVAHWDTSDLYGDCEELLGKWFKRTGKRDQIFLATKFGVLKGSWTDLDSSAGYCKKACEGSLKALGTDYIDLYYMHRANPNTPIEETVKAMSELKAEGKIRAIGLSEISANTLRRACKVAQIDVIQIEYSPFVLDVEKSEGTYLLHACRELGVSVVAYAPLGRGLLTGAFASTDAISGEGDMRGLFPRFSGENLHTNLKLVRQFKEMADRKRCTPAQLSLAWLLKQGVDVIPIPGTKKIKYLEENWGALRVQLTDAEEKEIRNFVENAPIAGGRGFDMAKEQSYVDTKEL
ncbi:putative aldo/keto reductase [Xylariaceae sp. AK1471]|nr:putative aldo/keto reductase [Xylariaceae sp. AK1471]